MTATPDNAMAATISHCATSPPLWAECSSCSLDILMGRLPGFDPRRPAPRIRGRERPSSRVPASADWFLFVLTHRIISAFDTDQSATQHRPGADDVASLCCDEGKRRCRPGGCTISRSRDCLLYTSPS